MPCKYSISHTKGKHGANAAKSAASPRPTDLGFASRGTDLLWCTPDCLLWSVQLEFAKNVGNAGRAARDKLVGLALAHLVPLLH